MSIAHFFFSLVNSSEAIRHISFTPFMHQTPGLNTVKSCSRTNILCGQEISQLYGTMKMNRINASPLLTIPSSSKLPQISSDFKMGSITLRINFLAISRITARQSCSRHYLTSSSSVPRNPYKKMFAPSHDVPTYFYDRVVTGCVITKVTWPSSSNSPALTYRRLSTICTTTKPLLCT